MSFRETRLFIEMMKSLSYSRIISIENFRTPNFSLVAEILCWLVERYDPNEDLQRKLDSEEDRITFIKMATTTLHNKTYIKLNSKRLYQADGYAVKELLKIVNLLYEATKYCNNYNGEENKNTNISEIFEFSQIKQIQDGKLLCNQLATSGATLFTLLKKEPNSREVRNQSFRKQYDSETVIRFINNAKSVLQKQVEKMKLSLVNIASDETNLDAKIGKKKSELERNHKRLSTLHSVRPAYMEEYEQLENELATLYEQYLVKFRNLTYLENQYEELCRAKAHYAENYMDNFDNNEAISNSDMENAVSDPSERPVRRITKNRSMMKPSNYKMTYSEDNCKNQLQKKGENEDDNGELSSDTDINFNYSRNQRYNRTSLTRTNRKIIDSDETESNLDHIGVNPGKSDNYGSRNHNKKPYNLNINKTTNNNENIDKSQDIYDIFRRESTVRNNAKSSMINASDDDIEEENTFKQYNKKTENNRTFVNNDALLKNNENDDDDDVVDNDDDDDF